MQIIIFLILIIILNLFDLSLSRYDCNVRTKSLGSSYNARYKNLESLLNIRLMNFGSGYNGRPRILGSGAAGLNTKL